MTPVDATSTSDAGQPTARATMSASAAQASRPASPVAALAFPELMATARMHP